MYADFGCWRYFLLHFDIYIFAIQAKYHNSYQQNANK